MLALHPARAGGVSPLGKPLADKPLGETFAFTRRIYQLHKMDNRLRVGANLGPGDIAAALNP